jgi:hypothetical protein
MAVYVCQANHALELHVAFIHVYHAGRAAAFKGNR